MDQMYCTCVIVHSQVEVKNFKHLCVDQGMQHLQLKVESNEVLEGFYL